MATRRNPSKQRRPEISENVRAFLMGEVYQVGFDILCLSGDSGRRLWDQVRDEILSEFVRQYPGQRPPFWWRYDAPRQPLGTFPETFFDGRLPQPRRQVAGSGRPIWESFPAYVPVYECGIPHLDPESIDLSNPPQFEAEASYLDRYGLLLPGEKDRLSAADFEPAALEASGLLPDRKAGVAVAVGSRAALNFDLGGATARGTEEE